MNYYQKIYAVTGGILGLGAPLGALLLRLLTSEDRIGSWLRHEWSVAGSFYIYMGIGTVCAFSLFGYFLGRHSDRLKHETDAARGTFNSLNLLATTDGLTGAYNHRYLQEHLAQEQERADRYKTSLSCLMLDIDDFKSINDTHGHPFGDDVLVGLVQIIKKNVRRIDTVGRYGGEEFMVIMPYATQQIAQVIAERIRQAADSHFFENKGVRVKATLSIGTATYPNSQIKQRHEFIAAVDQALYQAKGSGKNKTVAWASPLSPVKPTNQKGGLP